jgi:hypothetical protein
MFNLKQTNIRYSQANPKFYNYLRKYGLNSLEYGCIWIKKNDLLMFSAFNLDQEEISLLKLLTQLDPPLFFFYSFDPGTDLCLDRGKKKGWILGSASDLLITEQFFLDTFGLSLNIAPNVGTRESSILYSATRKKKK